MLQTRGVHRLDTARRFPYSEKIIGEFGASKSFLIATKANAGLPGTGKREAILEGAQQSLDELRVDKVDTYMLHAPDPTTPIAETLDAIQELYLAGKFDKFGLSNYSAEQVQEIYDLAKSKNYVLPSVYQAAYNLLTRSNETTLFPTLRALGMSIQAYAPLAGGFLVKYPDDIVHPPKGSRWDPAGIAGPVYATMYNKPPLLDYLVNFKLLAQEADISQAKLGLRWVRYHSALREEDSVVFGSYNVNHLESTLNALEKGPLEDRVVNRLEEMNKAIEGVALCNNYDAFVAS